MDRCFLLNLVCLNSMGVQYFDVMVFETKSSLLKFSPGRESSKVLMLKLGIFFKNSELESSSPRRLDKKSSFEVLLKGSSDSKHLGQVQSCMLLVEHFM